MQLFTAVLLSGDAQAKDWGRPKALALRTILGWGSLNCGESASGTKGSRQKFPQVPGGMKDAVGVVVTSVGGQGPPGGVQRVTFTQFSVTGK